MNHSNFFYGRSPTDSPPPKTEAQRKQQLIIDWFDKRRFQQSHPFGVRPFVLSPVLLATGQVVMTFHIIRDNRMLQSVWWEFEDYKRMCDIQYRPLLWEYVLRIDPKDFYVAEVNRYNAAHLKTVVNICERLHLHLGYDWDELYKRIDANLDIYWPRPQTFY